MIQTLSLVLAALALVVAAVACRLGARAHVRLNADEHIRDIIASRPLPPSPPPPGRPARRPRHLHAVPSSKGAAA